MWVLGWLFPPHDSNYNKIASLLKVSVCPSVSHQGTVACHESQGDVRCPQAEILRQKGLLGSNVILSFWIRMTIKRENKAKGKLNWR